MVDERVRARRVLGLGVGDLRAGGGLSQAAGDRGGPDSGRADSSCIPGGVSRVVLKELTPAGGAAMSGGVRVGAGVGEGHCGMGRGEGRAEGV